MAISSMNNVELVFNFPPIFGHHTDHTIDLTAGRFAHQHDANKSRFNLPFVSYNMELLIVVLFASIMLLWQSAK